MSRSFEPTVRTLCQLLVVALVATTAGCSSEPSDLSAHHAAQHEVQARLAVDRFGVADPSASAVAESFKTGDLASYSAIGDPLTTHFGSDNSIKSVCHEVAAVEAPGQPDRCDNVESVSDFLSAL